MLADTSSIYQRAIKIYNNGGYYCWEFDPDTGHFEYEVGGNYGDYKVIIDLKDGIPRTSCNCSYPGKRCKHSVAMLLNIGNRLAQEQQSEKIEPEPEPYLTAEEIKVQAWENRKSRTKTEQYISRTIITWI